MKRLPIFRIIILTIFILPGNNNEQTSPEPTSPYYSSPEPLITADPTTLDPAIPNHSLTTSNPTMPNSIKPEPTTLDPTTSEPTTPDPTTLGPITPETTTLDPTTLNPTTHDFTTLDPITPDPTTPEPTTLEPTTLDSTTSEPITRGSTTPEPTTMDPTTPDPTTLDPTTPDPTTIPGPTTPKPTPTILLDDYQIEALWTPKYESSVIIETDQRYIISVKIENCDLNGESGEYVNISTGRTNETLLFTYRVKSNPTYLFNSNRLYVDFVGSNFNNFSATFTRIGDGLTTTSTTEAPTTANWPTPSSNYSDYLTVFIAGQNAEKYKNDEIKNLFRSKVSQMAAEYCENENFDVTQDITINNVYISEIVHCSPNWPEHETCAEITFSVPVFLAESSDSRWTGYQLSRSHLRIMWDRYSREYFNEVLTNYEEPQFQEMLTIRIVLISLVTIGFVVGLMAIRFVAVKRGRLEHSDNTPIISPVDNDSHLNLNPYNFQETPPLFENMYSNFNPEHGFENTSDKLFDMRKASIQSQQSADVGVSMA